MGVKKIANCEICDQELAEGEFEENLGICPNCIMIECRADSIKSLLKLFLIFIGALISFVVFLSAISHVNSLIETIGIEFIKLFVY